jgi:rare lipoprotein A
MRRRFAEGLAVLLSVASLGAGAASGPSLEAAKVKEPQVVKTAGAPTNKITHPVTNPVSKKSHPYQVGTASWYGEYFQGKATASGEPYDMQDFTAAHPTLPLGSYVKVTNLGNGKAVVVRINDRGPVVDGRIIDVSYVAARALGFRERGVQKVRLDLGRPTTLAELEPVANLR